MEWILDCSSDLSHNDNVAKFRKQNSNGTGTIVGRLLMRLQEEWDKTTSQNLHHLGCSMSVSLVMVKGMETLQRHITLLK